MNVHLPTHTDTHTHTNTYTEYFWNDPQETGTYNGGELGIYKS